MQVEDNHDVRVPPRWFVRTAWQVHRALYRLTGGRFGLRRHVGDRWGMMRLTTTGRRSGQPRSVILGYISDGPNLVTIAMNGWADPEPAWWLNLQAAPEATLELPSRTFTVHGRAAEGTERERLWDRWREVEPNLDEYAALRSRETVLVVLEPVSERTD